MTYDIQDKPGSENVAADAFSRACVESSLISLQTLHQSLGHSGYPRLYHFVTQLDLPYSCEETRKVCRNCRTCAEVKSSFFRPPSQTLVQAVRPWDRLSVDFKGPVRGPRPYHYLLIVTDEYWRFLFVFPCKNASLSTVVECLSSLLCNPGFLSCAHSDRGASFVSQETRTFLTERGFAFSTSTPYHPKGNSQCEQANQTEWRTVKLLLHDKNLTADRCEMLSPEALHAVRSLVCLATNETPDEGLFRLSRRAMTGTSLLSWLQ